MVGLIGRRAELAALQRVVASVSTGESSAIVVEGEPGIGKTYLLRTLASQAAANGVVVLRAGITEAESQVSWAGLSALLDSIDERAVDELRGARRVLDGARGRSAGEPIDGDAVGVLAELVRRLASSSPTLLVLDDVQWLDRSSAAALTVAIRANRRRPVGVVAARRFGSPMVIELDRIDGLPLDRLRLTGLSVSGVFELLAAHGFTDLRRPDVLRIHELSQGNPLFAVELARLHRSGRKVTEIDELDAVQGVVVARLDGLGRAAVDAARVCALLARPTIAAVRSVVGHDAEVALLELEREGIIVCDGDRLRFTHPLRREGALATLGELERRHYHRRIADSIDDAEQATVHRGEATDAPDAALAAALERIADDAAAQGALDVAHDRYRRAERLTPADDVAGRWRRASRAVRCSKALGEDELVLDEAIRLFESAPSHELFGAALDVIEIVHGVHGVDGAADWVPVARARLAGSPVDEAALLERAVRIEQLRDMRAAAALAREALQLARSTNDESVIDRAKILAVSTALLAGEAVDLDQLPDLDIEHRAPGMDATMMLAEVYVWVIRADRAEAMLRPMEDAARSSGRRGQLVRVLAQLGDLHLRSGDWDAAATELAEAIEVGDVIGYDIGSRADLAWLEAARGRDDAALELIEVASRALATAPGAYRMQIHARRGCVHLAAERWDEAAADLVRAHEEADAVGFAAVTAFPLAPDLVEALLKRGEVDRARAAAEGYARAAERAQRPFDRALATRALALVATAAGRMEDAVRLALAAIELHGQSPPAPFEEARSRLAAAAALRRAGRKRDAREHAEAALATFEELGAEAFARRARAELDRVRTRQAHAGLTATEQRVAELAAAGHTNVEIATELSISLRTVESNLTRVYRKLGVRSRTQLAARIPG